jgi:hypothetical protein
MNKVYDRQIGCCGGDTNKTATVYSGVNQQSVKFKHHHLVLAQDFPDRIFKTLSGRFHLKWGSQESLLSKIRPRNLTVGANESAPSLRNSVV